MIKNRLQKRNRYLLSATTFFMCAFVMTACSENKSQSTVSAPAKAAKAAVAQPKPVQKQVSSSILKLQPPAVNQFDFSNKKDPFKPFMAVKADAKKGSGSFGKGNPDALPIHSFDVSQFKLIGIITGVRENKAMVTDPDGKGYVLKTGMLIGKNNGRIMAITPNGIDVLEQFKDDNGRVRKENIKLTLPRK